MLVDVPENHAQVEVLRLCGDFFLIIGQELLILCAFADGCHELIKCVGFFGRLIDELLVAFDFSGFKRAVVCCPIVLGDGSERGEKCGQNECGGTKKASYGMMFHGEIVCKKKGARRAVKLRRMQ